LDNYVKLTLDALNGVAWEDDRQVVRIRAVKVDRIE
jgi:Holliday junction resolvase RusA-like endonuclease